MHLTHNRLLRLLVSLSILSFSVGCGKRISEDFPSQYAEWFISPSEQEFKELASCRVGEPAFDSLLATIRRNAPSPGRHTVVLGVEGGLSYTLGYVTPETYETDSAYPLVIYLHGGIGTTRSDKGKDAFEMLAELSDSVGAFIASPSANRTVPWWSEGGIERILQSVRYMSLHYPIDPRKVFCAGVSDGATGCYAVANCTPGPFAGFFAVSGFGGMLPRLGLQLHPSNLAHRPIYNVNAGKDRLYPITVVREFVSWLSENGVPIEIKEYPQEEHGFEYRMREMGELAARIREWRRPELSGLSWQVVDDMPNRPLGLLSYHSPGSSSKYLRAYTLSDTLRIHSTGLSHLILAHGGEVPTTALWNNERVTPQSVYARPWIRTLAWSLHLCCPVMEGPNILEFGKKGK